MNKFLVIIMLFPIVAFTQITIPRPPEVGTDGIVTTSSVLGDFDGDGFIDVSVWWHDANTRMYYYSVYSYKKNEHLLVIEGTGYWDSGQVPTNKFVSDLDGTGGVEIIIKDKIYSYSNIDIKKKANNP